MRRQLLILVAVSMPLIARAVPETALDSGPAGVAAAEIISTDLQGTPPARVSRPGDIHRLAVTLDTELTSTTGFVLRAGVEVAPLSFLLADSDDASVKARLFRGLRFSLASAQAAGSGNETSNWSVAGAARWSFVFDTPPSQRAAAECLAAVAPHAYTEGGFDSFSGDAEQTQNAQRCRHVFEQPLRAHTGVELGASKWSGDVRAWMNGGSNSRTSYWIGLSLGLHLWEPPFKLPDPSQSWEQWLKEQEPRLDGRWEIEPMVYVRFDTAVPKFIPPAGPVFAAASPVGGFGSSAIVGRVSVFRSSYGFYAEGWRDLQFAQSGVTLAGVALGADFRLARHLWVDLVASTDMVISPHTAAFQARFSWAQ